jgi:predicted DNA-binding transcriptional regulator YafY
MPTQRPQLIVLKIAKDHAPYIQTKPMHTSQKILKEEPDGVIFSIEVIWNFELEREILGFGDHMQVLSPKRLCGKIMARMKRTIEKYQ